jgi:hypothetical protein
MSILICLLLLPALFPGMLNYLGMGTSLSSSFDLFPCNTETSFQKPCDMDHCDMDHSNPGVPKCPLCTSSGTTALYLHQETGTCLPVPVSSFIQISCPKIYDQGFVKSIFHPPTLTL